jgi:PAS domain S-box-containing protein
MTTTQENAVDESQRIIVELRLERDAALAREAAMAEVLNVINRTPGDPTPVFEAILAQAHILCGAVAGSLGTFDGEHFRYVATHGYEEEYATRLHQPFQPKSVHRALLSGQRVDIPDVRTYQYEAGEEADRAYFENSGLRTCIMVPLLKDGNLLGYISGFRKEVRPYSEPEVALLQSFGAQAVIAIENARLIEEQREALAQQTATAEVLGVINASPGNLQPVFDAILEKAHRLCGAAIGALLTYDGEYMRAVATHGYPEDFAALMGQPTLPSGAARRLIEGARLHHVPDLRAIQPKPEGTVGILIERAGVGTGLVIPLRKDGAYLGHISAFRYEVRPFSAKEIALLENFAAQAVIAMENARLIEELREALEQQTATAEVLQVINASPGNLRPVFETLLEKAVRLSEGAFGTIATYDGVRFHSEASRGVPAAVAAAVRPMESPEGSPIGRLLETKRPVHILDLKDQDGYRAGHFMSRTLVDLGGVRTDLVVPLLKDGAVCGFIAVHRQEVRAFSDKQIALLENFAAQAVIAIENARLLQELRTRTDELAQRQEELRLTFENMGDGVAMFDRQPRLVAWNTRFQEMFAVPDDLLQQRLVYGDYVRYLAQRGDYGPDVDIEDQVRRVTSNTGQHRVTERTRPDGRVIEIRNNPVAGGGFVLMFADITERKRNEAEIAAARDAAQEATRTIEAAFHELKIAQANLIQAEKMASLGQLTAGIAHEIKNPLNFVNNFASLSVDLLAELNEAAAPGFAALNDDQRAEIDDISKMLTGNLQKITEHGKRADGIVKAMLEHSRGASGERREVDINTLADEALNLAYHGARAQDQSFNITLEREFGDGIAPIELNPQDITRVFLNLFGNGFYAANRRAKDGAAAGFSPMLKLTTRDLGRAVEIRVRDNGTGIPEAIRDKLFQPFFTTKPTGEGTGLGLSITYDIVTKQHGGTITVDSEFDTFTEFVVTLPRAMVTGEGGRP